MRRLRRSVASTLNGLFFGVKYETVLTVGMVRTLAWSTLLALTLSIVGLFT